jgi:hypothetical protein
MSIRVSLTSKTKIDGLAQGLSAKACAGPVKVLAAAAAAPITVNAIPPKSLRLEISLLLLILKILSLL